MVSADNGFAKFNDALEGTHFNWTFLKLLSIDKSGLSEASYRKHSFSYPVQNSIYIRRNVRKYTLENFYGVRNEEI